jgi:beta-N-acetylhexosaminidase
MDFQSWSDEKLAGQRLMAGFEGTHLNREIAGLITNLQVGALILFRRNVETPAQLAGLCRDVQACARDHGLPPLIIAIDQEGGQVARLGPPFTQFPGNPAITNARDAAHFAAITAAELESVGINMNLAPVLDVASEGFPSVVAGRVFGSDPQRVAHLGATVIQGLQDHRIMSVAKHFPGIGRTTLDSHLDLPVFDTDLSALESFDLVPFRAAIQKRVAGIMLSHILYPRLDSQWPASLSKMIARDILRRQLGFEGVVMTDDLEMGAVTRHYGFRAAIRQVLRADIDMALICHSAEKVAQAQALIARKIGESETIRARAEASAARVMALKTQYLAAEPLQEIPGT